MSCNFVISNGRAKQATAARQARQTDLYIGQSLFVGHGKPSAY